MRRYQGFMADSARWERFVFRPDDVVISTPSKCGTTWMQTIVGMLLLDRVELEAPISTISPWLDMLIRSDDEVFGLLGRQTGRRFVKTHTPLDGVPVVDSVTYLCVIRHPLDVALSDRDHAANMIRERAVELRSAATEEPPPERVRPDPPEDLGDYLRWFVDNDVPPTGSGPYGLEDYCQQVSTYWDARHAPNVHLFHYGDMWADLDGEMRRVAAALGVAIDEDRWPDFVAAATLDSMRSRAAVTAPEAHLGMWQSAEAFFRTGGTRDWAALLTAADVEHFEQRLGALAGAATGWVLGGRRALGDT
jgi:aryl sulfotransferase